MKKGKLLRNSIKLLLWIILAILLVFIGAGIFISGKLGDDLKNWTVEQINREVTTKISVGEIQLSLFNRIPYISVVFRNVTVFSAEDFNKTGFTGCNPDTLLTAERIYLQLNILDVLRGNNRIKRIYAHTGTLNILTGLNGNSNYNILKPSNREENSESGSFLLDGLRISEMQVQYQNLSQKTSLTAKTKDLLLKGRFSGSEFDMGISAGFYIESFDREDVNYIYHTDLALKTILNVKEKNATIEKGIINLNSTNLKVRGSIDFRETLLPDLVVEGRSINISEIFKSVPFLQEQLPDLKIDGSADLAVKISGPVSSVRTPEIKAVYLLTVNEIQYKGNSLKNIQLKGRYNNGSFQNPRSSSIDIEKFIVSDRNSNLTGSVFISNFVSPAVKMQLSGALDTEVLNVFLTQKKTMNFRGHMEPDLKLEIKLASLKTVSRTEISNASLKGSVRMNNISFDLNNLHLEEINGILDFQNISWLADVSLYCNQCPVKIKGQLDYLPQWLLEENKPLWIRGAVKTGKLDLNALISESSKDNQASSRAFRLPDDIYLNVSCEVEEITYRNLNAKNLETNILLRPQIIDFENINLSAFKGKIHGNLSVFQDPESGKINLKTSNRFENLDIKELFNDFKNFNQDFITAGNLAGNLNGNGIYSMTFDSLLNVNNNEIYSDINLRIRSGELNNFEPARRLSRFIEVSELEHISFSELNNNILIKESRIFIPQMTINSSAFNISVSGTHGFDNYFDYKLKVDLSEILAGKAKNKLENQENFVLETDKRRASLYLSIKGNPDDFQVRYDKQQAATGIRESLREEKNSIKNILNEEFGWFNKDSLNVSPPLKSRENQFIINWEDEKTDSLPSKSLKRKKKKPQEEEELKFEWDEGDGR